MKIVVIGGTGLIGSKVVEKLRAHGHEAIAAAPSTGVNTLTGEGLADVLKNASVLVDVSNSPSFEEKAVMEFFQTAGRNLLKAGAAAGVEHHIALSIVGVERLEGSGYMRAKMAQEALIRASGIPYTIVHSTQFLEFIPGIVQSGTVDQTVHLSSAYVQPISSEDVADAMADVALGKPLNGIIEIAGPEKFRLNEIAAQFLKSTGDSRQVVADPHAPYFGTELAEGSLVPIGDARLGRVSFQDWLSHYQPRT